ncbi:MAG: 5-oxoprolinase subunit PxpB [Gemmatimonadaceae bacterium]
MGDLAVTITFGSERNADLLRSIHGIAAQLRSQDIPNVEDIVPSYLAISVYYDALRVSYDAMAKVLLSACARGPTTPIGPMQAREHRIPVVYDGVDLDSVADKTGLSRDEVIARHAGRAYTVDLLGFVPGFGYLSELDASLHLARREHPRARVAAGSVAIAGSQTAVYPLDTPGGWHIIGRTGTRMFDPVREPPSLLQPGDRVRFESVL